MNTQNLYQLLDRSVLMLQQLKDGHERYIMQEVPLDWRLIGIKGARGVGKTTL